MSRLPPPSPQLPGLGTRRSFLQSWWCCSPASSSTQVWKGIPLTLSPKGEGGIIDSRPQVRKLTPSLAYLPRSCTATGSREERQEWGRPHGPEFILFFHGWREESGEDQASEPPAVPARSALLRTAQLKRSMEEAPTFKGLEIRGKPPIRRYPVT